MSGDSKKLSERDGLYPETRYTISIKGWIRRLRWLVYARNILYKEGCMEK